jgi:hypothetical protein
MKHKRVTQDDIYKMAKLYDDNVANADIAAQLGFAAGTVSYHLKKLGKPGKGLVSNNKIIIPNSFNFKTLTPEKAFLLGVIFGDGHVGESNITIYSNSNDDILKNINNIFNNKLKISKDKRTKAGTYLRICKKQLCNELRETYNLIGNKSNNIQLPILPLNIMPFFLSGYWAADGSVILIKDKKGRYVFHTAITSCSKNMITDIYNLILNTLGVKGSIFCKPMTSGKKINSVNPCYCLQFGDTNALRVCDWLFETSTGLTRCKRKHDQYVLYKKWVNKVKIKILKMHNEGYSCKDIKKETRRCERIIKQIILND